MEQLFNIADSGNVMPPKSTWFEPKLRDGLLTHLIYKRSLIIKSGKVFSFLNKIAILQRRFYNRLFSFNFGPI
jgi:hypothetical protein